MIVILIGKRYEVHKQRSRSIKCVNSQLILVTSRDTLSSNQRYRWTSWRSQTTRPPSSDTRKWLKSTGILRKSLASRSTETRNSFARATMCAGSCWLLRNTRTSRQGSSSSALLRFFLQGHRVHSSTWFLRFREFLGVLEVFFIRITSVYIHTHAYFFIKKLKINISCNELNYY